MGNTYGTTRSPAVLGHVAAGLPVGPHRAQVVDQFGRRARRSSTSSPCGSAADHPGALRPGPRPAAPGPARPPRSRSSRRPATPPRPGRARRHASSQTTRRSLSPVPEGSGGVIGKIAGCGMIMRMTRHRRAWARRSGDPAGRADGIDHRRAGRGRRARHRVAGRAGAAGGPGCGADRGDRARSRAATCSAARCRPAARCSTGPASAPGSCPRRSGGWPRRRCSSPRRCRWAGSTTRPASC